VRRSKVGSTHEDVDGLFSVIKSHIKNKEIMTPDEMVAAIKSAFSNYSLPVFVVIVDATYDYKAHYKGHVDKKLGGYGYSADTDGYHCLQFDDSKTVSVTGVAFKKYQQKHYADVALQRKDLPPSERPQNDEDFVMRPMIIENDWEKATVLLTSPSGKPATVAQPSENFSWDTVIKDVEQVMVQQRLTAPQMASWREFVDKRPKTHEEMTAVATLPKWNMTPRPSTESPAAPDETIIQATRRAVLASAVRVRQPANIKSSVGDGKEGDDDRRARNDDDQMRKRDEPLESHSWVFYKASYDCCEDQSCGGCHIPLILGQLVGDLSEIDTLDGDSRVEVKCSSVGNQQWAATMVTGASGAVDEARSN